MPSLGVSFRRNQSICRRKLVARAQVGSCVDRHAGAADLARLVAQALGKATGYARGRALGFTGPVDLLDPARLSAGARPGLFPR